MYFMKVSRSEVELQKRISQLAGLSQSGFDACPPDGLPGKMEDKKTFIHQGR